MLTCPICKNQVMVFHKRSHILPEWMYSDYYSENHKLYKLDLKNKIRNKRQKGIYKTIICKQCEIDSQKFDHYASLILTERSPKSPEYLALNRKFFKYPKVEFSYWSNFNFLKLQKFVLATLLKAQLAEKQTNKYILIEKHFNKILKIYNNQQVIDDETYPIAIFKYNENDKLGHHIVMPYANKKEGHFVIVFSGAGYLFYTYVSSHKKPHFLIP